MDPVSDELMHVLPIVEKPRRDRDSDLDLFAWSHLPPRTTPTGPPLTAATAIPPGPHSSRSSVCRKAAQRSGSLRVWQPSPPDLLQRRS